MLGTLICARCKHHANDHDHIGHKQAGDPDLVDEHGRAFNIRMLGGGGAHDAPELRFDEVKGFVYTPADADDSTPSDGASRSVAAAADTTAAYGKAASIGPSAPQRLPPAARPTPAKPPTNRAKDMVIADVD